MRKLLLPLLVSLAAFGQVPSYQDLKFPPLRPVKIPNIETFTLSNGMRVHLLEDHELPLVTGLALVRTGNLFDPADKVGLAGMTGSVMRSGGTAAKTGDQLDEELENVAASVESSIGETSGQVSFSTLRENTDAVLGIFKDVLTTPGFRQEKIDLAKTQARTLISRRNDEAEDIAGREFNETIYGRNTPYGWRVEYATIANITRDDMVAFHRRYFFPANILLAVYGDFSAPEMKAKLERLFAPWDSKQPPVPPFPAVQAKPAPGVFIATKTDVNQSVFYVGHLGGVLSDKNNPALEIMGDILGGGFSSRLFQLVRTKLGYAYSIGADWGANYNHPGLFTIAGSTKSKSTAEAIEAVRREVERIRTSEPAEDELRTAKDTVLNSFVFNFDTPGKTLSRLLRYEYYGYPKDFIFQYQKAVEAVTRADVLRVARAYLRPQDFTIIVVGNPAEFGNPLAGLGLPVKPIDLTIPAPPAKVAEK
jgi:zinc protease